MPISINTINFLIKYNEVSICSRENQKETIDLIRSTIEDRNHLVLESPTGSGKTFTSLAGVLPFVKDGFKIVYCVRTNSQQKQVIHELKQFKKAGSNIKAIAIQGRDALCPQQKYDNELKNPIGLRNLKSVNL